jgi:hypothetical protein
MHDELFQALARSKFRSRFRLSAQDREYLQQRGRELIAAHARDFIGRRLAPAKPRNDGKQTPYRGHPVFTAQHATGTCCRGCLEKWHRIERGRELSADEQAYVVDVLLEWMERELQR